MIDSIVKCKSKSTHGRIDLMNKLKIVITGDYASGKTTIALMLADVLRRAGFGVWNGDYDVVNGSEMCSLSKQDTRVQALVNRDTIIDIETVQVPRKNEKE